MWGLIVYVSKNGSDINTCTLIVTELNHIVPCYRYMLK